MNHFIVATHSKLAEGLALAVEFFDNSSNLHYLNAYVDGATDFEEKFVNLLEEIDQENIIVFTDLPGGSVNRIVCQYMEQKKLKVISGVNLPLMLELVLKTKEIADNDIENAILTGQQQLIYMNSAFENDNEEEELND
ncbi:PTS fructose transporter subunit IIA [Lactobacillus sp. YT155]|uniref:PTS sugar transporter subunit IIA n=1 Tax=Lactobacillus sp. YT155 TaxID=3060955 RepID=UPI00265F8549|nr:PTS fructose transporter subunit IIA [Lactobacillus sp. YT155]MDO1605825.1 PTS fructose transporter subunit IIA [Lactobacillus sp. YT155]